jgi:hypothetical protein
MLDRLDLYLEVYIVLFKAQDVIHMQCTAFDIGTQELSNLHCMIFHMDRLRHIIYFICYIEHFWHAVPLDAEHVKKDKYTNSS